ncbi:hypothetical protein E3N88_28088 [Mikania micrantha]|uniref:Uncharacterized protein n=1 Tax=Mikania micrantha TaxID=192012 RepID=A0A5N6MZQ1_9ASTR|nr:hypothetical protein E3N88_28088 [Mikania micrantha]
MSQHIPENIQRDAPIIESASDEATPLDQRLSPRRVNVDEAATTAEPSQVLQDSGTGNRTSSAATHTGEDFFEALLNEGNPGCQETTSDSGGAGARLRTPSPNDSTHVDEDTNTQELTATITSFQARVAHLEAEVATLRLEVQAKEATILDLRRRPLVILTPFHLDPATTTLVSPDATKKGEKVPSAGPGPEAREEEVAQDVNPSIVTLINEWDDFLGTYFHHYTTSSSSSSSDDDEAAIEMELQSPVGTQQSPSGTKSPSETTANVAMEETTQEEQPISMEPVSPSGTKAAKDLFSIPEHSVELLRNHPSWIHLLWGKINGQRKKKTNPEEETKLEERVRKKKKKGRPDTSLDDELIRLSAFLQEKGYDIDEVLQQEQAATASKAMTALTKKQKDTAYRDKMKAILLQYGLHARQLGPMKNSTMDMHVRDIKAKIARGELPSMEMIQAQRASLNLGLGLGGGVRIEMPLSGAGIREGEEVICGEATKAMFPNMFPLDPKEELAAPPSSPSLDNMPISLVIKINKGKKAARKQQSTDPDPERQSKADERSTEHPRTEDADQEPTARTNEAVGSNVEEQHARDQRSQAIAHDRPRFKRRKSIARRIKRTLPCPLTLS